MENVKPAPKHSIKAKCKKICPVRRFQCQRFNEEMCTGPPKDQRDQDFN